MRMYGEFNLLAGLKIRVGKFFFRIKKKIELFGMNAFGLCYIAFFIEICLYFFSHERVVLL